MLVGRSKTWIIWELIYVKLFTPCSGVNMPLRVRVFKDQRTLSTAPFWWHENGYYYYNTPYSYESSRVFEHMTDFVTPNFKERVGKGEIINNDLFLWREDAETLYSVFDGKNSTQTATWQMYRAPPLCTLAVANVDTYLAQFQSDIDQAITQAWANVDESTLNVLASGGEGGESIKYIVSLYQRACYMLRVLRGKLTNKDIRRLIDRKIDWTPSQLWMEFRYGFRPLVFDLVGVLRALRKSLENESRNTGRGQVYQTPVSTSTTSTVPLYAPYSPYITYEHQTFIWRRHRAGVLYAIQNDLNGILDIWGINQPLEAIYEITPFSFILDWFFNVGDVLSSWSVSANLTPLASWIVTEVSLTERHIAKSLFVGSYLPGSWHTSMSMTQSGLSEKSIYFKKRTVSPSRPIIPTLNLKLDLSKILDLAIIGKNIIESIAHRR